MKHKASCGMALAGALLLSGCVTIQPPGAADAFAPIPGTINGDIAIASQALTRHCAGLQTLFGIGAGFAITARARAAVANAAIVLDTICAATPSNIGTAVATATRAYRALQQAEMRRA